MKAFAATAGLTALVLSLSVPALLLAQEPVPVAPAPAPEGEAPVAIQSDQTTAVAAAAGAESAESAERQETAATKASASVDMEDYKFVPKTVTIAPGDTVTWANVGEEEHDADGDGFSSGTVQPGEDGTARFATAGTFKYICTFHPNMKGTVVVKSDDDGSGGSGGSGNAGDDTTDPSTSDPSSTSFGSSDSSSSLPATGQNEIPLIIVGAALMVCGLLVGALWRHQAGPYAG